MASPQPENGQSPPNLGTNSLASVNAQRFSIHDWRKAQSVARKQLLYDFNFRRSLPDVPIPEHIQPLLGNGSVAMDVSLARRHYATTGERLLLEIVRDVYGVVDLHCGIVDFPSRARDLSKPYSSSVPDHLVRPWDQLVHRIGPPMQTVTQLEEELTRSFRMPDRDQVEQELYRSEHMMTIINARGTVLLNRHFHGTPEQKKIVKLAMLALHMWNTFICQRERSRQELYGIITESEWRRLRMAAHILPLIRDDIQNHLHQAVRNFSLQHHAAQKYHIDTLFFRLQTWAPSENVYLHADWAKVRSPGSKDLFRRRMEDLREIYETRLRSCVEVDASRLVQDRFASDMGVSIQHASEYIGLLQVNGNGQQTDKELVVPWMKRREDGFWFRC